MDSRLMPPSHFDPNEQDSLEVMTPIQGSEFHPTPLIPRQAAVGSHEGFGQRLLRPVEFSSPTLDPLEKSRVPLLNIGRTRNLARQEVLPDGYQCPQTISASRGVFIKPHENEYQSSGKSYSELIRLQAENEALKSVIHCKKTNMEYQATNQDGDTQNSTKQTIIEHQTQHIMRLHKEIEDLKTVASKRDAEVSQFESAVGAKEKENRKLSGCIESLEAQLEKKNEEGKLKDQEIEDLQKMIRELRKDKEELIKCHAEELNKVKQKYVEENESCVQELRSKMDEVSVAHGDEKTRWRKESETLENKHKHEMDEIRKAQQAEVEQLQERLREITSDRMAKENEMGQEIAEERARSQTYIQSLTEIKHENEKLKSNQEELKSSLESSQQECNNHLARISQLQAYVGQQQAEDYERSQWKTHRQQYEESIVELQTEKETMTKTLELQNIRLQSITKILMTQEEAINANTKALSGGSIKGNPVHIIIRRWREKVFELMVQCRYNEITMKSMEDKCKSTESKLKEELEEEKRVCVILENQLSECKAQLEIQQRENGLLFTKCENLSNKLANVAKSASEHEEVIVSMSEQVAKSTGDLCQSFQDKFTTIAEKTVFLEQRLVFANNRMRTLSDLLLRRENLWRAKMKRTTDEAEKGAPPCHEKDVAALIERPDLAAEIDKLTQERNALSQKLSTDSATFGAAIAQYKERETALENEIASLQCDLQDKSEELAGFKVRFDEVQEELRNQERAAEDALEDVKNMEEKKNIAIEEKLQEVREVWDSEKLQLEKKLEESQREHARTVVTSRQSERIAIREKKRATENFEVVIEEYRNQMAKIQGKLKAVKRDNNLLMTTLRQHGLMSSYKAARLKAKKEETPPSPYSSTIQPGPISSVLSSKEDCHSTVDQPAVADVPTANATAANTFVADTGNVADMLKDLVALTENLLVDSD